jgi:formamidopyrimidine-DNA glycosylase
MPELPEVETMRRGLLPCVGGRIAAVRKPRSRYRPIVMEPAWPTLRQRLLGRTIAAIERLGKRVLVKFDNEESLVIQPKMAGLVSIGMPPKPQHVRLVLDLEGAQATPLVYWDQRGLGTVKLWTARQLQDFLGSGQLGPDALSVGMAEFRQRFSSSHREVKPTLMDQQRIAGIGNLYASEILHRCFIHPRLRADRVSPTRWRRIYEVTREVLEEAIRYEGSTLSDGSYRNALHNPGNYQNAHRVYDREGLPCLQCKRGIVERIVQSQRSTFYCPRCQKMPKMG